ncbi:phosphoketolase, partial [Mesorhizobium sp. M4B.F.Ca.ET.190.01.1.1]
EPASMHERMAVVLDDALDRIEAIQQAARKGGIGGRPKWPMIVLRSPKGWTGPKQVDGLKTEGFWRAHQVPLSGLAENPAHLKLLEEWLRSYR